nr:potassium channel family protein [Sphingomonas jejuensis]
MRRNSTVPLWLAIGWRVLFVVGLIALAIAVHWFDRAGLRDNYDGDVSFSDVVYFTMISITTTGYGDIAPVTERARLFDALIVTPIRIFIVLIFLGTAYRFVLQRIWEKWRMAALQRSLRGHFVIAGFGTSGGRAVRELITRGTDPAQIVVIDRSDLALEEAASCGCLVIDGDATRDVTLKDVHIERACALIVSAGRDDTSILITLTARHLAPDIRISVTVRAEDNELLARQAGADIVINPVNFAGVLLAGSCQGSHIADYLADLATASGRVQLVERPAAAEDVGHLLRDLPTGLGVRLYRAGASVGWWEGDAARVQEGDQLVLIRETPKTGR